MSTQPSLADVLNAIINAITATLNAVAQAISDNASAIGTVLVIGGLIALTVTVGSRAFRSIRGLFGTIF